MPAIKANITISNGNTVIKRRKLTGLECVILAYLPFKFCHLNGFFQPLRFDSHFFAEFFEIAVGYDQTGYGYGFYHLGDCAYR